MACTGLSASSPPFASRVSSCFRLLRPSTSPFPGTFSLPISSSDPTPPPAGLFLQKTPKKAAELVIRAERNRRPLFPENHFSCVVLSVCPEAGKRKETLTSSRTRNGEKWFLLLRRLWTEIHFQRKRKREDDHQSVFAGQEVSYSLLANVSSDSLVTHADVPLQGKKRRTSR